jgi:galactokinase
MSENVFLERFGGAPTATGFAPGRVNLIGEHIDYNGGLVLPAALAVGLETGLRSRNDNALLIASDRFNGVCELSLTSEKSGDWSDYALGALVFAHRAGWLAQGAEVFVASTIPDGAGLSSSAALIVAILKAARALAGADATNTDIAVLARRVENEFIDMPCGIMDQMAVSVASPGQAIALNTKTLDYKRLDLPADYHMAVVHSGQSRKLSDGRYRVRKEECDRAKAYFKTDDLCHVQLERVLSSDLPQEIMRRVRHCVTEQRRTVAAANALARGDIHALGALMNESHLSMRDDFEMSTPVIDALVTDATTLGAVGARLTGGGFGGCIVAAVPGDRLAQWSAALLERNPSARFVC